MFSQQPHVLHHSWFDQGEGNRQSLEHFGSSMETCVKPLTEVQDSLQNVALPFKTTEILPFQCRNAMIALVDLNKRIDRLCELFSEIASLPLVMIALRYRFLDELYFIEEQAANLIELIDSYYDTCMAPNQRARQQKSAINELFTTVLQHIADIPTRTCFLFDEAKFQEMRIVSSS